MNILLKMDSASLATLHAFENYDSVLDPALFKAMDASISALQAKASDIMWSRFKNPMGTTEDDSWEVDVAPYLSILTNTAPQATRLDYGFSGKTDSLGRTYYEWPSGAYAQTGYQWAEGAMMQSRARISDLFQAAIDGANLTLGRSAP